LGEFTSASEEYRSQGSDAALTERLHRDDWDTHWDRYAAAASLNPAQLMRHRAILAALGPERWPLERLLDFGSGQGDFLAMAARAGVANAYVGFELSESGVSISRAKVPGATFAQVDLFAPPPESQRFVGWATAAVCSEVIEHVDDPLSFLRALRNYLADDALLILTVPGGPMSTFDRHIGHRRHYTSRSTTDLLTQSGFDVETIRLLGFPFFNLYRLLVIMRGARLIKDVEAEDKKATSGFARVAMAAFGVLFKLNLPAFPLGWQVLAVARKKRT
jgi:SAM-dependent methyltransferase